MRSARFRLALWYISIVAAVLCCFSVLFYVNVAANLAHDLDHTLALQADGVAETVFAFWRAERATAGSGPGNWQTAPSETFEGYLDQGGLPSLLSRWAEKTGNLDTERLIRIVGRTGQLLGASARVAPLALPLTRTAITQAEQGQTVYETFKRLGDRVRLVTRPVMRGRHVLYCLQVAASLHAMDADLARLRFLLFLLVTLMLAATSAIGLALASQALEPIRRLIRQSQQFVAESLHERLEVPEASDEMGQLDTIFPEMLTRLERAFRRLRQFSAAASHELRTPLTVMKGEIGVALCKSRSAEEYRRILQTHLEVIDEMASTVEELLRLAQSEAAEGALAWEPVDLSALTRRISATFKPIAKSRTIRLKVTTNGAVWVSGERRLLERLLANLLDNAMTHTPMSSAVTATTGCREQEAFVTVHDTGLGIPPEKLPLLFDQFFTRRSRTDAARSTGLGLGLCRWIVETHHGHLDVTSVPGQGTTFIVRFPRIFPPV